MQHPRDYVEHLKRKSVPERERIALICAAALTAVVALGYLVALTSSERLAIKSEPLPDIMTATAASSQNVSNLLGAAAAFNSYDDGSLTVVESSSSSTIAPTDEGSASVIPF